MVEYKYIYGPVPSRRMGISIGISPIPKKYCNYSCVYCQLGRTTDMTNTRRPYFLVSDIIEEFKTYLKEGVDFDIVTIVGEGEPTLYLNLGELILEIKKLTSKPIAVITNGSLLSDAQVRNDLKNADIVLPSLDAPNKEIFKEINRPFGEIVFKDVIDGLRKFSNDYKGELWIEIMIVKDINDSTETFMEFKKLLDTIDYDRLYINAPIRPPAESFVSQPSDKAILEATKLLGGISIDRLVSEGFYSEVKDDYSAIKSIIKRHPMNQYEIKSFLVSRECNQIEDIFSKLNKDDTIDVVSYKNYNTYRLK